MKLDFDSMKEPSVLKTHFKDNFSLLGFLVSPRTEIHMNGRRWCSWCVFSTMTIKQELQKWIGRNEFVIQLNNLTSRKGLSVPSKTTALMVTVVTLLGRLFGIFKENWPPGNTNFKMVETQKISEYGFTCYQGDKIKKGSNFEETWDNTYRWKPFQLLPVWL